jgi:signal transduction histidine kinase
MSVVLLLSLAAVGVLVNHYQEQFMQEVQTTASDVGQAALRTFEWTGTRRAGFETALHRATEPGEPAGAGTGDVASPHHIVVAEIDADEVQHHVERIKHIITTSTEDRQFTVQEQLIYPAEAFPSILPGEAFEKEFEACLQGRLDVYSGGENRFLINVEAVRAETDPMRGLVLKIPRLTPTGEDDHAQIDSAPGPAPLPSPPDAATPEDVLTRTEEIQLPIGGNYENLFATLRNRSLFLFMGVFVVGLVLSTGLASRFTRPIRKLDAGIRKLSAGDLDVAVDAGDKGEIGRLARAFNEMAGKLRANREREREMVRREKLSSLGRLAAGVAHDVRNPLHSIGLTLQHLSESARPESTDRQEEFDHSIDVIRGEIRRLDDLVGNFLRFARTERQERRPVDMSELLRETVLLVEKEAERRGVRIDLATSDDLTPVMADGERIRSAILNLILNSFEAMPEGGALTLELRADGDEVVLVVADTGEGIPEEDRERVFDFAYTSRETGHGLGLAMVHHCVVEEHGGRVSLESRPGEGTEVRLRLPTNDWRKS